MQQTKTKSEKENPVLPPLRSDLEVFTGPVRPDGSRTYTIYDPVPRVFHKIGWIEASILNLMQHPRTLPELYHDIKLTTTIDITEKELNEFCADVIQKGLTIATLCRPVKSLMQEVKQKKVSPLKWIMHHYLYFRIPLIKPDKFLEETVHIFKQLWSPAAFFIYCLFLTGGLYFFIERAETYLHTFTYFFTLKGLFFYGLAIAIIKIIHEFAHAYVAKHHGVRVPTMGVAFIVMWPLAFCDVTDAWRIPERTNRFTIAVAGVVAELIIASIALFGWGITNPGILNSIFFVVSSVSLLSTLLINLNPAMQFDGYYMLMDMWGIDNLRPRAFAITRWALRRYILGMDVQTPEQIESTRQFLLLIFYSIYAWIYRFFLYLGIAFIVYYKFTKILGIVLFLVELWWFILMPLINEMKAWIQMRKTFRFNKRLTATIIVMTLITAWAAMPLPRDISIPGVVVSKNLQTIYAPNSGMIKDLSIKRGDFISSGLHLLTIESEKLKNTIKSLRIELQILENQLDRYRIDPKNRASIPQKKEEIKRLESEIASLEKKEKLNRLYSVVSGELFEFDETLFEGCYIAKDKVIGHIANLKEMMIVAFVNEKNVGDITVGDTVFFQSSADAFKTKGQVIKIDTVRSQVMKYLSITSAAKGEVPVIPDQFGRLIIRGSYFAVEIEFDSENRILKMGQSGKLIFKSKPRSLLINIAKDIYKGLLREVNF